MSSSTVQAALQYLMHGPRMVKVPRCAHPQKLRIRKVRDLMMIMNRNTQHSLQLSIQTYKCTMISPLSPQPSVAPQNGNGGCSSIFHLSISHPYWTTGWGLLHNTAHLKFLFVCSASLCLCKFVLVKNILPMCSCYWETSFNFSNLIPAISSHGLL